MPKIGEKSFDVRLVSRFIHQGEMKRADYDKHLKALPDETDNFVETRPGDPDFEAEQSAATEQRIAARDAARASSEENS